jgi:hypothetical protein
MNNFDANQDRRKREKEKARAIITSSSMLF